MAMVAVLIDCRTGPAIVYDRTADKLAKFPLPSGHLYWFDEDRRIARVVDPKHHAAFDRRSCLRIPEPTLADDIIPVEFAASQKQ